MVTDSLGEISRTAVGAPAERQATTAFEWIMVALSAWFVGGLCLDGWAHAHGKVDSSFFTPWHAVFYSGFGAVAVLLGLAVAREVLRGQPWHTALPAGYGLALLGAPLFALSGVGDLVWHQLFGIERGVEALLSPTHLGLIASMLLIVSAPLRAGLGRGAARWRDQLPALVALTLTLTLLTFISEYAHPFIEPMANQARSGSDGQKLGVAGVVIQAAILAGALIVALRLRALPAGAFTLLLAGNAAMIAVLNDQFWTVAVAAVAGIAADILYRIVRPSERRPMALRLFVALVPMIVYALYFLALMRIDVVLWRLHAWAGTIALAGAAGLLLAVLVTPQASDAERPAR